MKRDEILAMEPGLELDTLVGQHVIGFEDYLKEFGRRPVVRDGRYGKNYFDLPSYSSDISAAWEAWRKVQRDHVHMSIHWMDGKYLAEIIEMDPEEGYKYLSQVECDTAPEAICKAALLAVMNA